MLFPEWSDMGKASDMIQNDWSGIRDKWAKYWRYFSGTVFTETVPIEADIVDEAPLLYPVGVNLVKMLCMAQTDASFGEWSERAIDFGVSAGDEPKDAHKDAIDLLHEIYHWSNGNSLFYELELDRNVYGGAVARVNVSLAAKGHIRWSRVPLEAFFPIWSADDENRLLEVFINTNITRDQAKHMYGYQTSEDYVPLVEHWTEQEYSLTLDGKRLDAYSGRNPYGIVPFVYIPRIRTSTWWGDALTEDIIPSQDEINMRLADMGEAINYNSHPIRWGKNLPKNFTADNFPMAPNAMWDLGRQFGANLPPEVGILQATKAVDPAAFEYVKFLYDWARTSCFAPPIAFGEDNGGGQRSGATLEIRMWPLVKAVRRSRVYLSEAVNRLIYISGRMLKQKGFTDIPVRAVNSMLLNAIVPVFAEVMPRDHTAQVDEVLKMLSTTPPSISLSTAVKLLGYGAGEEDRIMQMLKNKDIYPNGYGQSAKPEKAEASEEDKKDKKDKSTEQTQAVKGENAPQPEKQ